MESNVHTIAMDRDRYYSSTRVMQAIIHSLVTCIIENSGDTRWLTEAYEWALENAHIEDQDVRDIIEEYALFDVDLCKREYEVTVTVPVTVSLTVMADDADTAESEAIGMIECDGLDNYHPDYDLSWGIEVNVETV